MTDTSPQTPQAAEGMIPKAEIMPAIQAAGLAPDIMTALQNWLIEQPGDAVPQEAFMLELAELAEVENHLATSVSEMADEVQSAASETKRLDDQQGVVELQIQRDGLAQMEQYATMAEELVSSAEPQSSTPQSPAQPTPTPQVTPDVTA